MKNLKKEFLNLLLEDSNRNAKEFILENGFFRLHSFNENWNTIKETDVADTIFGWEIPKFLIRHKEFFPIMSVKNSTFINCTMQGMAGNSCDFFIKINLTEEEIKELNKVKN